MVRLALLFSLCFGCSGFHTVVPFDSAPPDDGGQDADFIERVDAEADTEADLDIEADEVPEVDADLGECFLLQEQAPILLSSGPESSSLFPRAVLTDHGWAIFWLEGNEESGAAPSSWYAFVRGNEITHGPREIIRRNHRGTSGVWTGSELALCWSDVDSGRTNFVRLTTEGERVVSDSVLFDDEAYGCSLRVTPDGFLALLSRGGRQEFLLAWLDREGRLIDGPVSIIRNESGSYLTLSMVVLDDGIIVVWAEEPEGETGLQLQRFDLSGRPVGATTLPVSEAIRPIRPVLREIDGSLALLYCSDRDDAPEDAWSIWLRQLSRDGAPIGAARHVTDVARWERPDLLVMGNRLLMGTVPRDAGDGSSLLLDQLEPDGRHLGDVHFRHEPDTRAGDVDLSPGRYWGHVGLTFSAYGDRSRTDVFFTSLSCGE